MEQRKYPCAATGHEGKPQYNAFRLDELVFDSRLKWIAALYAVEGVATCHACWMRAGMPKAGSYAATLKARGEFEGTLPEELAAAKNAPSRPLPAASREKSSRLPTVAASASAGRALPKAASGTSGRGLPKAAGSKVPVPKKASDAASATSHLPLPAAKVESTGSLPRAARTEETSASLPLPPAEPRPFERRSNVVSEMPSLTLGAALGERADGLKEKVIEQQQRARAARLAEDANWLEDFTRNGWCVSVDDPHIDYESLTEQDLSQRVNPEDHWYAGRIVYRRREVVDGKVVASGPKRGIVRKHGPIVVDGMLEAEPARSDGRAVNKAHWRRPVGGVAYHAGPDKKFSVSTVCEAIPFHLVRNPESLETGAGKSGKWVPYVAPRSEKPTKSAAASCEVWLDLTGKPWTEADYTGESVESRTVDGKMRTGQVEEGVVAGRATLRLVLRDGRQTHQALIVDDHTYSTGQLLQWVLCKLIESRDPYVQLIVGMIARYFPFGEGEQYPAPRTRATPVEQEVQPEPIPNVAATDSTLVS